MTREGATEPAMPAPYPVFGTHPCPRCHEREDEKEARVLSVMHLLTGKVTLTMVVQDADGAESLLALTTN